MRQIYAAFVKFAETIAALMMAAMFLTFILQIFVRYSARLDWLAELFPFLSPSNFGWTLEFCLFLWVWLVFWGNAFVVRQHDHVRFDILFNMVSPAIRRWIVILSSTVICLVLLLSIEPTWSKFAILRLKKTASLGAVFGDWVRMRDIYSIYILFLAVVALRYGWAAYKAIRFGAEDHVVSVQDSTEK